MPPRFTNAQRITAAKWAQELFDLERLTEEHAAISPPGSKSYTASAPPVGFLPLPEQTESYTRAAEEIARKECKDFVDHVAVVCACMFLCRVKALAYAGENQKLFLEAAALKTKLHREHIYAPSHTVIPPNPHPLLVKELGLGKNMQPQSAPL
ncbi:hypothetical protein BT96DRAFT_913617 [Gymnopus androsaceus JB14]|uniref:Uncharacterized protein n=1 Tax=Gymnopus androsaceus JB14 TaxID=1447944 RepID=A0A6A4IG24_9AGAR|nr:hypothetical protein BT96DRAFT_913617 [Gymnopus androsaceus JB14]